jgi:hypothetical protein
MICIHTMRSATTARPGFLIDSIRERDERLAAAARDHTALAAELERSVRQHQAVVAQKNLLESRLEKLLATRQNVELLREMVGRAAAAHELKLPIGSVALDLSLTSSASTKQAKTAEGSGSGGAGETVALFQNLSSVSSSSSRPASQHQQHPSNENVGASANATSSDHHRRVTSPSKAVLRGTAISQAQLKVCVENCRRCERARSDS